MSLPVSRTPSVNMNKLDSEELLTARLRLRTFRRDDVDDLVRLAGEREVAAHTLRIPHPYTKDDAEAFLERQLNDRDQGQEMTFAITDRETGALLGSIGVVLIGDGCGEVGYWVGKPHWGRGVATEALGAVMEFAFARLGLSRLQGQVMDGNPASSRVLERVGMRHEGTLRQRVEKWGARRDIDVWGLLAHDREDGEDPEADGGD